MRFASCKLLDDRIILYEFEKDYNNIIEKGLRELSYEEAAAELRSYEFLDILLPAKDILYFAKNYPPVKKLQLGKIITQDLETTTPFKESDVVFEFIQLDGQSETTVYVAKKALLRRYLDKLGEELREKVRSIVPEEAFIRAAVADGRKAIIIGDNYCVLSDSKSQIIRNFGLADLYRSLRELAGNEQPEEDYRRWLDSVRDLSKTEDLSEDEIRIKKAIEQFYAGVLSQFGTMLNKEDETSFFFGGKIPGNGEKLISHIAACSAIITVEHTLKNLYRQAEHGELTNLAKGDFAYKGGLTFLKRRIIITAALFFIAVIILFASFELKLSYLSKRSMDIDEKTKKMTTEVLGKEYPSLKQALSIMEKTIQGKENASDKKSLYPYSALFIMEKLFPDAVFEGSTIEIKEFSVKEGKVRMTGMADSLDNVNTMFENLEKNELVTDINKGQITSAGGKNMFSVGFSFQKKQDTKKDTGKKDGKKESKKKKVKEQE